MRCRVIAVDAVDGQHGRNGKIVRNGKSKRTRGGDVGRASRGADTIAAVNASVGDAVKAVEVEQKIILHQIVGVERGSVERHLPVLVRGRAAVKTEAGAAPIRLRAGFVKDFAAGLIGDLRAAIEFEKSGVKRNGRVRADGELRISHRETEVAGVVGNVPHGRQTGGGAEIKSANHRDEQRDKRQTMAKVFFHQIIFGAKFQRVIAPSEFRKIFAATDFGRRKKSRSRSRE